MTSASVSDAGGQVVSAGNDINFQPAAGGDQSSNLAATSLSNQANAQTALTDINTAIADVAAQRGYIGSQINALNAAAGVDTTEMENLTAVVNSLSATNFGQATTALAQEEVLMQTGIAALAETDTVPKEVLQLMQ